MLNLAGPTATVTGWTSPEFDGSDGNIDQPGGYPYQCATNEPFYIQAAAWSPDDSTIYLGSTGYHPYNMPVGATPRADHLAPGMLVVADARCVHAVLFGEVASGHHVTGRTSRIALFSVGVEGVPMIHIEEALWVCVETLAKR